MEKLKTVFIPPQKEVSDEVAEALIKACQLNASVEQLKKMLCDGRTTNMIEHLKPEYLNEYLARFRGIEIEYRAKDTDNK